MAAPLAETELPNLANARMDRLLPRTHMPMVDVESPANCDPLTDHVDPIAAAALTLSDEVVSWPAVTDVGPDRIVDPLTDVSPDNVEFPRTDIDPPASTLAEREIPDPICTLPQTVRELPNRTSHLVERAELIHND